MDQVEVVSFVQHLLSGHTLLDSLLTQGPSRPLSE
jgi:hypothetical protein